MKLIIIFICSLISLNVFSDCTPAPMKELIKLSSNVILGEVILSNSDKNLKDGDTHEFSVKVIETLKGPSVSKYLNFSYKYEEIICPDIKVFEKGEKAVLFLKNIDDRKATLLGNSCEVWGFSGKNFNKGSTKRKEFESAMKTSVK